MPKLPILNREIFFEKLNDGSMRLLDWAVVNTPLGAMVEPRQLASIGNGKVVQVDVVDTSFTKMSEMDEDAFYSLTGTGGRQVPVDFNY